MLSEGSARRRKREREKKETRARVVSSSETTNADSEMSSANSVFRVSKQETVVESRERPRLARTRGKKNTGKAYRRARERACERAAHPGECETRVTWFTIKAGSTRYKSKNINDIYNEARRDRIVCAIALRWTCGKFTAT